MAPGRRALLLALLLMPMSLSLGAAIHQDGPLIAASVLATALIARSMRDGRFYWWGMAVLALVLASKPPYLPICVVALLPWLAGQARLRTCLSGGAVAIVPAMLWSILAMALVTVPFGKPPYHPGPLWSGDHAVTFYATDAAAQLKILWAHPTRFILLPLDSLWTDRNSLVSQFVGILAWLDLSLPKWAYELWFLVLGGAVVADVLEGGRRSTSRRPVALPLVVFAGVTATILMFYLVSYLTWTDVGAQRVDGIQGRYLIPIVVFASLGLPLLSSATFPWRIGKILAWGPLMTGILGIGLLPVIVVYTPTHWKSVFGPCHGPLMRFC